MRFRRNIERIGEIFAYEISKIMKYEEKIITTPLGKSVEKIICSKPSTCNYITCRNSFASRIT